MALDDLASELDRHHQAQLLEFLHAAGAQVLITGTERPPHWPDAPLANATMFHVEHGQFHRL